MHIMHLIKKEKEKKKNNKLRSILCGISRQMTECVGSIQDGKCNGPVGISLSSSAVQVLNLVGLLTSVDAPGRLLLLPSTGRCGLKREREREPGRAGAAHGCGILYFPPSPMTAHSQGRKTRSKEGEKRLCVRGAASLPVSAGKRSRIKIRSLRSKYGR